MIIIVITVSLSPISRMRVYVDIKDWGNLICSVTEMRAVVNIELFARIEVHFHTYGILFIGVQLLIVSTMKALSGYSSPKFSYTYLNCVILG